MNVHSVVPRITIFGSRYIYMNDQLQALGRSRSGEKKPTEHTGHSAGWILGAAKGNRESTPPPEIKLLNPGRLGHCLLTVPYRLSPPSTKRSDFKEILFRSKENLHSYASLRE